MRRIVKMLSVFCAAIGLLLLSGCGNQGQQAGGQKSKKSGGSGSSIPLGPIDYIETLGKQKKSMESQIEGIKARERAFAQEIEKQLNGSRRPIPTRHAPTPTLAPAESDKDGGENGDADPAEKDAK
jgi:hypothetical protein